MPAGEAARLEVDRALVVCVGSEQRADVKGLQRPVLPQTAGGEAACERCSLRGGVEERVWDGGAEPGHPLPEPDGPAAGEVNILEKYYVSEHLISAAYLCFHHQLLPYTVLSFYCVPVEMSA